MENCKDSDGPSNASFNAFNASHCHWAIRLRCGKVPGLGSGICLLEKVMIFLLSQHKTISILKIKYNFFD